MKISIAMATFNGEKYILEQLESIAKQTKKPDEIVICDDCSTDNTLDIINKFKRTVPFDIVVHSNESNLGYTQNFNKAMQLCSHDLVFLSDQDDVWFPSKIELMVGLAEIYPAKSLFMIDAELVDENLNKSGLTKLGQIKGLGLGDINFVMGCCSMVRKNYLDLVLPVPDGFLGHDNWIVNIADYYNLKHIEPTSQQYYRIHGSNTSVYSANKLVKTKKWNVGDYFNKVLNCLRGSAHPKEERFSISIRQKEFLIDKLEQLEQLRNFNELSADVLIDLRKNIDLYEKRMQIVIYNNFLKRFMVASRLYFNHSYRGWYRIGSYLGDIFCV